MEVGWITSETNKKKNTSQEVFSLQHEFLEPQESTPAWRVFLLRFVAKRKFILLSAFHTLAKSARGDILSGV